MAKQKMSIKKKASAVVASLLVVSLALGGAYAWTDYSQSARNTFKGNVAADVLLHDDFNGENKDVYVENTGNSDVFVRVKFAEYLQIGNNSVLVAYGADANATNSPKAKAEDVTTWPVHQFTEPVVANDNSCGGAAHEYYSWSMTGAAKDYLAGVTEADPSGRGGLTEAEFNGMAYSTPYVIGNITTTKETTLAGKAVMMLSTYLATSEEARPTNCWLLDSDGWAYWSDPLAPGTATNLLLDKVSTKEAVPYDNWLYNIDVQLQAASVNELDYWYLDGEEAVADPDNRVATTTAAGKQFIELKIEQYSISADSVLVGEDGNYYQAWGANVYREVELDGDTYVPVTTAEPVLAGHDRLIGTNDDNMLSGRSGGVAIDRTTIDLDTDPANPYYRISATTDYVVTAGIDKELGTYDDVITSPTTAALGKYDLDGDTSDDNIGWNYLGGPLTNMLMTTEYVLDNVKFNDTNTTSNIYEGSTLHQKLIDFKTTLNVDLTKINNITVDMTQCSGENVYACTNETHIAALDHTTGGSCTFGFTTYYTDYYVKNATQATSIADQTFFALSIEELQGVYGDSNDMDVRQYRLAESAPKFRSTVQNNVPNADGNYVNTAFTDGNGDTIYTTDYWLRSPGYVSPRAAGVTSSGNVNSHTDVTYHVVGVRPACYMNLAS